MRLKNLERYKRGGSRTNMQLAIPVPRTPEGRAYRYSPNPDAHPRHFVLGDRVEPVEIDDWKRSRMMQPPGSPRTVCPYSGTVANDEDFEHPDDRRAVLKMVEHAVIEDVHTAVHEMLSGVARKSKGVISYKPSKRRTSPRPRFGRRDLMRLLVCDHCGRDYGVFAIGLFCPDCGAPNIALHFAREVDLVSQQVEVAEGLGNGKEELAYRLLGNAHEDVLTAFEAILKTLYLHARAKASTGSSAPKPVVNDFQNIEKGQKRFAELSIDPFAALSGPELDRLSLNIQKRHVIGHNLGVVDAKFAQTAGSAKIGETVKLVAADIKEFAALCHKVIVWLDEWLGEKTPKAAMDDLQEPANAQPIDEHPKIGELGPLATEIAVWLCKASLTGMPDHVDAQRLTAVFAGAAMPEIAEAVAELEADSLVNVGHAIGIPFSHVRTTEEFFLTVDPVVLQTDPMADAISLAELVLDGRESVTLGELHAESGLELRRFNPAISLIVGQVHEGRISHAMGEQIYPTRYFFLAAEDRVAIRRLVRQLQG